MGSQIKSVSDHVCQKVGYIRAVKHNYGKDRWPNKSRKLLNGKAMYPMMKWDGKVALCEFIHPIRNGRCNVQPKQPKNGMSKCPIENVLDGKCLIQSSIIHGRKENIWDGGLPHMHENWDGNNAP